MKPPRLAHVFIFTADLERMAAFYVVQIFERRTGDTPPRSRS